MTLVPNFDHSLTIDKIIDKLGWLTGYELELTKWNQMLLLTRQVETYLKQLGINNQSPAHFSKNRTIFADTYLDNFQQHIFDYLTVQSAKFKNTDTFLATSDVIESLFGKYKQFSVRCPFKEMGLMILTIYLSTMDLTTNLIKDALESISFVEVEDWLSEVFGRSTLSKRKTLFSFV